MKKFVFLGPSLPLSEAQAICPDAIFLPPAKWGDFLEVLKLKPTHILLIDGFFEATPATWHKEILFVMAAGVVVLGASSMGALRAAELYPFGMIGIGKIYEWYRNETTRDDAEVALLHLNQEHNYREITEPLVNIRATFGKDSSAFKAAQAIGYRERVWQDEPLINQKALDACEALQKLCHPSEGGDPVLRSPPLSLYFKGLHQQVFCRASTLPLAVLSPEAQLHSQTRLFGSCYVALVHLAKLLYAHHLLIGPFEPGILKPRTPSLFEHVRWPELSDPIWLERILNWKALLQSLIWEYFQAQNFQPAMSELKKTLDQWQADQKLSTSAEVYAKLQAENCSVQAFESQLVQQTLFDYFIVRGNFLLSLDIPELPNLDFFAEAFHLTEGKQVITALSPSEKQKRLEFIREHQEDLKLLNAFEFYRVEDLIHWLSQNLSLSSA